MELAVHLRTPAHAPALDEVPRLVGALLDPRECSGKMSNRTPPVTRIYCGDEFCAHRLPSVPELEAFCRLAEEKNLAVTLLTPILSDTSLDAASALGDCLARWNPENEVVINDWGALLLVRGQFPRFRVGAGRLLNKGFKDPRLREPETLRSFSSEGKALLEQCTFEGKGFQEKAAAWGVCRLEQDLLPYGTGIRRNRNKGFAVSVYFPYGYVTAGRICWVAAFDGRAEEAFVPLPHCACSCVDTGLALEHEGFAFPVIQNGNAVFYRYSPSTVAALFRSAVRSDLRVVFQGLVL